MVAGGAPGTPGEAFGQMYRRAPRVTAPTVMYRVVDILVLPARYNKGDFVMRSSMLMAVSSQSVTIALRAEIEQLIDNESSIFWYVCHEGAKTVVKK